MNADQPVISFVSVATGRYLEFWHSQIQSARDYLCEAELLEFVVFTDRKQDIQMNLFDRTNWNLVIIPIEQREWPYPSLLKFYYIHNNASLLKGRFIWHLDADMLFASDKVVEELIVNLEGGEIITVAHPGYFRPEGKKLFDAYLREPLLMIRDSKKFLLERGLGAWERNHNSTSFVPNKRKTAYVCGGSWGGERDLLLQMCKEISERINRDELNGVMARFHDESHLNWYVANHDCRILDPSYCFEQSYLHLRDLEVRIVAVNKSAQKVWVR